VTKDTFVTKITEIKSTEAILIL